MKKVSSVKRKSILEGIDYHLGRNIYCERKDLSNEASVEAFFVNRMLADLGFKDKHIKTKESLASLTIAKGSKKYSYKPDYCLVITKPKLILDAKSPSENIYDWVEQCAHYCLLLNRKDEQVEFFIVTNGIRTAVYKWDKEDPVLELSFEDFYLGNEKYEKFRKLVSLNTFLNPKKREEDVEREVVLKKVSKEKAQKLFLSCHNYIWNTEKRSPQSAFTEFVKLVFLKLWNDRILHEKYETDRGGDLHVPVAANTFSVRWIESREEEIPNPVNDVHFTNLLEGIQDDIDRNNKKRIFDVADKIKLKPSTIKGVVKKLEGFDLLGIDEDLNGRLFETFLSATMRGEALGQYFTPRSIVLLATKLAHLKATEKTRDKILDASCGTGGFLIEAFTIMRNAIRENKSYSEEQKNELISRVSNECLYGVDAAADPNLARIARINMYLHGDGGSHIYFADGLQKNIQIDKTDDRELQGEIKDMKENMLPNSFDAVLTNPPFSTWYEMTNEAQANVLKEYKLAEIEGTKKYRRLRGSAMFIERYEGLLKPGGKLISVVDETVLASSDYEYVRDFVREHFIIRAVISLHGDAFQMAKSRVKTSIIFLEKKKNPDEEQPSAFMYSSIRCGVDDLPITTNPEKIVEARELADKEIDEILQQFERYENGQEDFWLVPPERLVGRLDVKYCIPLQGRMIRKWKRQGFEVKQLGDVCEPREEELLPREYPGQEFRILTITYDGRCKTEELRLGKNINYKKMKVVREGDLVFSEYNTFNGAIGYITKELDGALASGSYTVVRCESESDALYLWSILRTTEIRADFLTSAVGMGRQTVKWDNIKEVHVPLLVKTEREKIAEEILQAWQKELEATDALKGVSSRLHEDFDVESEESKKRFQSAKPPK